MTRHCSYSTPDTVRRRHDQLHCCVADSRRSLPHRRRPGLQTAEFPVIAAQFVWLARGSSSESYLGRFHEESRLSSIMAHVEAKGAQQVTQEHILFATGERCAAPSREQAPWGVGNKDPNIQQRSHATLSKRSYEL
jgi:hypothetical protein